MSEPVTIGIAGSGWRTQFFLRVCQELPARFRIGGMVARDAAKGRALEERWGVATYRTLDEMLTQTNPLFVITSVAWPVNPGLLVELAERGVPTLSETPPAPDLDGLLALHRLTERGAKIQIGEQYRFQPPHAARLAAVATGKLGRITQAQVSIAHGYHGINLLRLFLGVGYENATITARRFVSPLLESYTRDGLATEEHVRPSSQTLATFDYGDRLGVFDFTDDQYFSWVRTPRLLVRGERGEINTMRMTYLRDHATPISVEFTRSDAGQHGNLEGLYHRGYLAGDEWLYRNPFTPARLTDDELAIATCFEKMADYARGGPGFYSLAEASQDHYLNLMVERAAQSGMPVTTTTQPWATAG